MRRGKQFVGMAAMGLALILGVAGCNRGATSEADGAVASESAEEPAARDGGSAFAASRGDATRTPPREEKGLLGSLRSALAPKPKVYTLDAGTPIRVRTTSTISTKSYDSGQTFAATLAEPLVVEDKVIAPRGAEILGRVVNSNAGGRVKGVASITLTLTKLETGDGREVSIDTNNVGRQARATKKKDATKIGIGAGIGAAIGAIAGGGKGAAIGAASGGGAGTGVVMATRGDPAVVPAESLLTFRTQAPVTVTF
ncbi:MAG: hypothetical protein U5J83_12325 [Bryobacterales bacterium]|nr:hypothetical protein [Bryobacterales bacterium]